MRVELVVAIFVQAAIGVLLLLEPHGVGRTNGLPALRSNVRRYRVVVAIGIRKMIFVHNAHLGFRIERRTSTSNQERLRAAPILAPSACLVRNPRLYTGDCLAKRKER
jgi:hypothetical protein